MFKEYIVTTKVLMHNVVGVKVLQTTSYITAKTDLQMKGKGC